MSNKQIDLATFEELKRMSGADFIDELIDTFLEDVPKLMGELQSALQAGNAEAFRRAAHSLKSNAATFGAAHLSEQARELEMLGKEGRLKATGDRIGALESSFEAVSRELKGLRG